jgi:NitT/TauT family transport system permease protein
MGLELTKGFRWLAISTWVPALVLIMWELYIESIFFPKPSSIVTRILEVIDQSWIASNVYPTLSIIVLGYLLGLILGTSIGLVVGYSSLLYRGLTPFVLLLRKMPSVAKFPIILAILGIGFVTQIFAVTLSVTLMIALVTSKAIYDSSNANEDLVRLFGLSRLQSVGMVHYPARLGEIWSVAKAALQVAVIVTIFSETVGSGRGVGYFTLLSKELFDIEAMWIGMLVLGAISLTLHLCVQVFEKQVVQKFFPLRLV